MDSKTKSTVQKIPLLRTKAGPRDGDAWMGRLAEEYNALIKFVEINKEADADWFKIDSDATGIRWSGKCWYVHEMLKYEFDLEFEIPATYPSVAPEIKLPELEGKTPKMYRGGIICTTDHFKPLWSKNSPHFGIAHALALGVRRVWAEDEEADQLIDAMASACAVARRRNPRPRQPWKACVQRTKQLRCDQTTGTE